MRGALTALAIAAMLASAFGLYATSYATRRLEVEVQAGERTRAKLIDEIAVLKADRAFLARPQRIEAAARRIGMQPPAAQQRGTNRAPVAGLGTERPR